MTTEGKRREATRWIVMATAVVLALLSWRVAVDHARREAGLRFRHAADGVAEAIVARVEGCEFALRAAGALFASSDRVDHAEWRRFVEALRPLESMPGLLGLGFARRVEPDALDAYQLGRRAAGDDAFSVFPVGGTPARTLVVTELLEPLDGPNRRAIGFDLTADPMRRAAIQVASDTRRPALSGPVRLVQDQGVSEDATGMLMFVPVIAPGAAAQAEPMGYVYGPMRAGELMRGVLPREVPGLALEVFDGAGARAGTLVHASAPTGEAVRVDERTLELPGRQWTMRLTGTAAFDGAVRGLEPTWVAAAGAAVNLALLAYLRSESRERARSARESRRLAGEVEGRREAELAMRDSERRFREVVEASPTGLLIVDASGRIELANPAAERLFGYGTGELLGVEVETLVPDALRGAHRAERAEYQRAPSRRHMGRERDVRGLRRDGTELPLEAGLSPIGEAGSGRVLASIVDLSTRRAAQLQLESALREKTLLLDEVHHRVKNNLQVIVSLLSLQARGAPPEARAALAETRNRVHAMALTHQLLHENGDVARLRVGEYLERLARLLADGQRSAAPQVVLRVEGGDTPLHLELPRAIPCGLLVNELVTDAYRRTRPGEPGEIVVGLALDDDEARLWVADDGLPPPSDEDPPHSLGAQLVPLLVDQLGGTLVHAPGASPRTEVRFPAIALGGRA